MYQRKGCYYFWNGYENKVYYPHKKLTGCLSAYKSFKLTA